MAKPLVRYDNDHDVHMRLQGTFLRYQGDVYFCEHGGGMNIQLYRIDRDHLEPTHKVDANDPDLDISSVPLGYCNVGHGPVYFMREAARKQKQGVSLNNIVGYDEKSRRWQNPIGKFMPVPFDRIRDTILGQYPSLDTIIKKKDKKGAAFHRRVCIMPLADNKWKVKYMANFVGIFDSDKMSVRLVRRHQGNSFLRSVLETRGIQIHEW